MNINISYLTSYKCLFTNDLEWLLYTSIKRFTSNIKYATVVSKGY